MSLKKSIRWKRSARLNKFLSVKKFTRLPVKIRAGAIAIAMICVTTAAIVIGARQTSPSAPGDTPRDKAARTGTRDAAPSYAPVADALAANAPAEEPPTETSFPKAEPVTITGCLERVDETFRLKDTAGAYAPKSRSWKSGFLKKGSASIEVVDATKRLKLPAHVGQRVSVTGVLMDREMQVRSLQRVAASCTNNTRVKI